MADILITVTEETAAGGYASAAAASAAEAESAKLAAQQAKTGAEEAENAAEEAQTAADQAKIAAEEAAATATTEAGKATTAAGQSEAAKNTAVAAQIAASASSDDAQTAQEAAEAAATTAGAENAAAQTAAGFAIAAKNTAVEAAEAASISANTAEGHKTAAANSETAAAGSANLATTKANLATSKAAEAAASAADAANSASSANSNAQAATTKATEASFSAGAAAASELAAQQAQTAAETAKALAEAAKGAAQTAQAGAEQAESGAQTAQAGAEQAESGAQTAQAAAELAKTGAEAAANTVAQSVEQIAVNTQSIASLENVISSANINQETTATVTGVDTVSLPKTAANTGMQVQLFGQSAEQLVANGNFANGTTGWTANNSTISASNNILTNTGNGVSDKPDSIRRVDLTHYGNKLYINFQQRVTSANCVRLGLEILYYNNTSYVAASVIKITSTPTANLWYTISEIPTLRSNSDWNNFRIRIYHEYADSTTANGKISELRPVKAINLTATFGAGNEPTKEQCDVLFANYFEGSDNVLGTGRVRSVGKNLFNLYGGLRDRGDTKYDISGSVLTVTGLFLVRSKPIKVSKNTSYYINAALTQISGTGVTIGVFAEVGESLIKAGVGLFNSGANELVYIGFSCGNGSASSATFTNIILTRSTVATDYEPYRQSILQLTTPELRSNGLIKDEIRKGTNGYELVRRINPADGTVLTTPLIIPIAHAGLLNSNSNGTAYFEPIIADAGVYASNLAVQLTDYPIASFESIRKYANGTYTELSTATAAIAGNGLSFTHPNLAAGDLVMFTYAYNKESIGRSMTLTHYDSRFVIADTANSKVYRWRITSTNGVASIALTEV